MTGKRVRIAAIAAAAGLAAGMWATHWPRAPEQPLAEPVTGAPVGARRAVSFSPALTELVFALGQEGRLVGVSSFCTYPPEARRLPACGGHIDPNLELLARLAPDVVVIQGESPTLRDWCQSTGQRYVSVKLDSLEDIWAAARRLGEVLDCRSEAEALVAALEAELRAVRLTVARRRPVRVFLCLGREPGKLRGLMTAGRDAFITDVLRMAGGENVFADAPTLYPQPSLEALVARRPEVILDLQPEWGGTEEETDALVAQWGALDTVPAVRNGRVTVLTEDYLLIPGPRVGRLARRLATVLHPEAFPNGSR